ncbi:MAG: FkbM family methyltransferase [Desulfobacterales bacterium]|nr:FkbM family methyltransferase [Desulfobacterales bacterium]
MKKVLRSDSNCIDIGCYRGEILKDMIKFVPDGRVFAFEPVPANCEYLSKKFPRVDLFQVALGDEAGLANFYYDSEHPARSGLAGQKDLTDEFQVEMETLDHIIPGDMNIDLIKIDVEGAEYKVIKGGENLIKRCRPVIIFECNNGSAELYNCHPGDLFDLISKEMGLKISSMSAWLKETPPFNRNAFIECVHEEKFNNFIACCP